MKRYPTESLLRPAVEMSSAATAASAAALALLAPSAMMMTPAVAVSTALLLGALAVLRGYQGWTILRYRRQLSRLPYYELSPADIPAIPDRLFLGLGFDWTQKHTQRLWDTERSENARFLKPGPLTLALTLMLGALGRASADYGLGGLPAIHGVGMLEGETSISMPQADRPGHTAVLGTTRVGKTRLAEVFIAQDIRDGHVTIVFDPKGDAALMARCYTEAKRYGRLDNLYVFHLGFPDHSARYNPVGTYDRVTEVAGRITNQLPGTGNSAAFRQFSWGYVNTLAKAVDALGQRVSYKVILTHAQDIEPLVNEYLQHWLDSEDRAAGWRDRVQYLVNTIEAGEKLPVPREIKARSPQTQALYIYVRESGLHDPIAKSLLKVIEYDRSYYDRLIASLYPLLEKLTTGKVGELLSPDYADSDERPIFDWATVIRTGGIVYIGLDALSDPEVASVVGATMFADLTSQSGRLYKYGQHQGLPTPSRTHRICIHADEMNELMGPEFVPMVNKAGGAGYQVTGYTQTMSDVEVRIGTKAGAGQVWGNLNTIIMLRVQETDTARFFTEKLPKVEVNQLTVISGATDNATPDSSIDFTSSAQQRQTTQQVELVQPATLMSLPKGQAFARTEGGKIAKIRLPMFAAESEELPDHLAAMAAAMRQDYRSSADWAQYAPSWTDQGFSVPATAEAG